jgi:glutamyl-tRNA reductase
MDEGLLHLTGRDGALTVVGLNHRTAAVEVRERFWVSEIRGYEILSRLRRHPEVREGVVLATCNRTEFIVWASGAGSGVAAIREMLESEFGLTAGDWEAFYRYAGDEALRHVFRVACGLDSMVLGEPEITGQVKTAWARAQQAGATSRYLDAVFQKALNVSKRVRCETAIGSAAVSVPYAAVQLARQIFGPLEGRRVLVIGAGKMGEASARSMLAGGASELWVTSRTLAAAEEMARKLGGTPVEFAERWKYLAQADIVLSSTGCPHVILDRSDAERMRRERGGRPVFLIDIAVPRDVDPAVREIPGVFLYDIDDLERVVRRNLDERRAAAAAAERLIAAEQAAFRKTLEAQRVVPTIVAVRERLEEIRRQEMQRFLAEIGPLGDEERRALDALTARLVERIAGQVARELKRAPERPEQDRLAAALHQLFHLPRAQVMTGE